jgi:hypothetical protein
MPVAKELWERRHLKSPVRVEPAHECGSANAASSTATET